MPIITASLAEGSTGSTVKTLHSELRVLGFVIETAETNSDSFKKATKKAVTDFQGKYYIDPTGTVDKATGALMTATATFVRDGNTNELRDTLTKSVNELPKNPVLVHWLTRYEILAGNYEKAREAFAKFDNIPDSDVFRQPLEGILDEPSNVTLEPEIQHPSNFYTYQYSFFDSETLEQLSIKLRMGNRGSLSWMLLDNSDGLPISTGTANLPPRLAPVEPKPRPPTDPDIATQLRENAQDAGSEALSAFRFWNLANLDMSRGLFSRAERHYSACQDAAVRYFLYQYRGTGQDQPSIRHAPDKKQQLVFLLTDLDKTKQSREVFWNHFKDRDSVISLDELHHLTWVAPYEAFKRQYFDQPSNSFLEFLTLEDNRPSDKLQKIIEVPLVTLIYVLIPLAKAEAMRQKGNLSEALQAVNRIVNPLRIDPSLVQPVSPDTERVALFLRVFSTIQATFNLQSIYIEKPFALLLKAQILLEKANKEYKARRLASAKETYQQLIELFDGTDTYKLGIEEVTTQLKNDVTALLNHNFHPLAITDAASPPITKAQRREFDLLGKKIEISNIEASTETFPGLDKRMAPQQPMLKFKAMDGATNPLIFALIAEAKARLLQIENNFNYLGYSDEYVPPWKFQFLLERARYFTDHAKNTQREYLNFLSNAEREELQEITASQTVEMEKSNVRIETARVEQVRLETEVAKLGVELGNLTASNAQNRLDNFLEFEEYANDILGTENALVLSEGTAGLAKKGGWFGSVVRTYAGLLGNALGGGAVSNLHQNAVAGKQREMEKKNLALVVDETHISVEISQAQLKTAQAALIVSGLQRTASILRHEYAIQNLNFMRNRTLNTETWYRLAAMIRSVADTYMGYAVELAFLAEQAYEFEADKRINVIRFDYDSSEEGRLLAADFLKQDLDTLEQDLIVTQKQRKQQVKYVLSLSRDFPEALQALRENDSTIFTLRLEQLERKFPGLLNIRIGSVDILPIALLDPLQFSLQVTYLGSSQVRLKSHPDTMGGTPSSSPLNTNDLDNDWLDDASEQWPIKIRVTEPETAVYSGLSQAEAQSVFPFVSSGQRGAFESLGAAASWHIDMSMKENKVVPGSLADVLITFNVSGYFDPQFRSEVDAASQSDTVLTSWLSAKQNFSDQFYEFNQTGKLSWNVTRDLLSFDQTLGALRNISFQFLPSNSSYHYSQIQSRYIIQFEVEPTGDIKLLSEIPKITFNSDQLTLNAQVDLDPGAEVTWDFGDETVLQLGAAQAHTYQHSGMYNVRLRVTRDNRLSEFHARIAISEQHAVIMPNTSFPEFTTELTPENLIRVNTTTEGTNGQTNTSFWKLGKDKVVRGRTASFDVEAGTYLISFTAIRQLKAHIYSKQRFDTQQVTPLNGLRISSNREFDLDGNETTVAPNEFTNRLFQAGTLSPIDEWTAELRLEDNQFLKGIGQNDIEKIELDDIADVALVMEYEVLSS